jgi:UDP-2,4-diacetamido-2,4,6-trideoxy-beta-L-altropyranose hydrolase
LFLADAGQDVGGGHVMRCLALAEALRGHGAACAFLAAPAAAPVLERFADGAVERLPAEGGGPDALAGQAARAAGEWRADIIVADHYGLGADQHRRLREGGRRLAVIDDLTDRVLACDLVIDPTLGRGADAYGAVAPRAKALTGPNWALIRPEFAAARAAALKGRRNEEAPRKLLISLGLTDVGGVSAKVLAAVQPLAQRLDIEVVVGSGAPSRAALDRQLGISVRTDARNMAELIGAADIGIGAGGASVWERACLGLPSILVILADNQRPQALELADRGAVLAVDAQAADFPRRLATAFSDLRTDPRLRSRLSQVSAALCDGRGAVRAAEAVLKLAAR